MNDLDILVPFTLIILGGFLIVTIGEIVLELGLIKSKAQKTKEADGWMSKKELWICKNSSYCHGNVRNDINRVDCWNCGMRRDDKRRKEYPKTIEVRTND